MTDTGHKDRLIGGKSLVDHMKPSLEREARYRNVPMPTDEQIALVAYELRMHTIMAHAVNYDTSELGHPEKKTDFYPEASSIGRFLRDAAQVTFDK